MTSRDWLDTFADPATASDLMRAARAFVTDGCIHAHQRNGSPTDDPDYCDCEQNRVTPIEFAQWLEREARFNQQDGGLHHLRPAGQPNRKRDGQMRLSLMAG